MQFQQLAYFLNSMKRKIKIEHVGLYFSRLERQRIYLSLCEEKPNLHALSFSEEKPTCMDYRTYVNFSVKYLKRSKNILALNICRACAKSRDGGAVLTECQTSDCDVKCRITFIYKGELLS